MASVSQTIPNYISGISEQPDQLKAPGQVRSTQNSIPDVVRGLYKRPGAKRLEAAAGGAPLTNVQTGGSWFHYYRDETEGSYIGQVAQDGRVRMWSCNDGVEKNVWYHTDNDGYDSNDANHTSITSYLTPSTVDSVVQTEDIQALTINDTTFLNNRSKIVTTTGTTDARPHKNWAFVEILRTENGRQYSLNIYSNEVKTTLNTATRVKVATTNLDQGDGTGSCPGIGTQVFSVDGGIDTNGNASTCKNLIFRITTLGQQGLKSNADDTPTGSDYQCSYNYEVTLLHGGEGWVTNFTTGNVTLDNAKTDYTYNVKVMDHEGVPTKANIKAVRPAPTPFDADTAVTVDAILGGITGELSGVTVNGNALNYEVIGNGIYFYTAADNDKFNIEVVDQDLMRVMQSEINDVTNLPIQCKDGAIVKISNTRMSDEDDYYVKFIGENGLDGVGTWQECAAPGITKSFNAATMPHVLQRQADGDFLVKQFNWRDRDVGDDVTNALPSFADGSSTINKVLFFRNRLVFLSGENVVCSRPGSIANPNFWADSALTVAAIDPIDISCASMYPSDLYDAIEINTGLVCFSSNAQFLLSSDDTVLNPDTAKLRAVSWFNYNKVIPPISLGQTLAYIDNSNKYSRLMELANIAREGEPAVVDASTVVPTLLPKSVDLLTNSRENNLVLIGKTNSDEVIGWRYFNTAEERKQAAWFKWKHNNPLKYHFIIEDVYYFLDSDNFLQRINLVQSDTDPSLDQDSVNYLLHLDNYTTIQGGVFNTETNITTFTDGTGGCEFTWQSSVTTPNGSLVLVDNNTAATRLGRYAECTVTSAGTSFTVPGDWSSATVHIGYLYEYNVEFPRFYKIDQGRDQLTTSDVNAKLIVHRTKINFGKIGLYETTLARTGKSDYTETWESTELDEYDVSDAPYLVEEIRTIPVYEDNRNVRLTLKSSHPAPATLRSMSWEGDYSPLYYRRV